MEPGGSVEDRQPEKEKWFISSQKMIIEYFQKYTKEIEQKCPNYTYQ